MSEGDDHVCELEHDVGGCARHQRQSTGVVGFDEIVKIGKPVETLAVDSDDDPGVGQTSSLMFEVAHVLEVALGHGYEVGRRFQITF